METEVMKWLIKREKEKESCLAIFGESSIINAGL